MNIIRRFFEIWKDYNARVERNSIILLKNYSFKVFFLKMNEFHNINNCDFKLFFDFPEACSSYEFSTKDVELFFQCVDQLDDKTFITMGNGNTAFKFERKSEKISIEITEWGGVSAFTIKRRILAAAKERFKELSANQSDKS